MKTVSYKLITLLMTITIGAAAAAGQNRAQVKSPSTLAAAGATGAVAGSGSAGQITKWLGVFGSNTYTLGDSVITEDKFGRIGIGTTNPTSPLTVAGVIETTGGVKFPDGTIQTTAGLSSVVHDATLKGNGTAASPLGIAGGQVVRSLNGLTDQVTLVAGANISITPVGNTLTLSAASSDPASTAFQQQFSGDLTAGAAYHQHTFQIPAGKRLVIEHLSFSIFFQGLLDEVKDAAMSTYVGGESATYHFIPSKTGAFSPIIPTYTLERMVRIYHDSVGTLVFGLSTNNVQGGFVRYSVSGHLIDLPK